MTFLAATQWPDAAIAIVGIALVTTIASVLIWQIFATGRRAIGSEGGKQYKQLARRGERAARPGEGAGKRDNQHRKTDVLAWICLP